MPKIHGLPPTFQERVEERYGKDSAIAQFVKRYKIEKGKVLLERTTVEVPAREGVPKIGGVVMVRQHDVVVGGYSYKLGQVVMVPKEAPTVHVAPYEVDGQVKGEFVVVAERDIYATKRIM